MVNVASKCGLTAQYTGLERLHEEYADQGFTVLGVPCNQFLGQEPGTPEEIAEFCSTTYGVTFPMTEKVEVNGTGGTRSTPARGGRRRRGRTGDIRWNFEKFLVDGTARSWPVRAERRAPRTPVSSRPSRVLAPAARSNRQGGRAGCQSGPSSKCMGSV